LARIASLLDGLTPSVLKFAFEGFSLTANVFGGECHPCPPLDMRTVRRYVTRIAEALPASDPGRALAAQTA
jgi:hypothetical protein